MAERIGRLTRKSDFDFLFSKGRRYHSPTLTLIAAPHVSDGTCMAIVVTTATEKKATRRNLFRRRIRETVRSFSSTLRGGYYFVFMVRPPALKAKPKEIREVVAVLLRRAGILPPFLNNDNAPRH